MMLLWMVLITFSFLKIQLTSGSRFSSADCNGEPENEAFSEFWLHSTAPTAVASDINGQCIAHTREYLAAYRSRSSWAVKMYESSGRLIEDLIFTESGNVDHQSGLFDECISIQPGKVPFQGKYCSIFFDLRTFDGLSPGSDTLRKPVEEEPLETVSYFQMASASFCIPSTCSAHDLRSAVAQRIGHRFDSQMNYSVVTISNEDYCFTKEKIDSTRKLEGLSIIPIALFFLLALAVISATIYEAWRENYSDRPIQNQAESFPVRTIHCFSLIKNWRKLISIEDSKDNLSCLHGIRVLSIFWVVLLHVSEESLNRYTYNKLTTRENAFRWEAQIVSNGTVAVDTFFLLGGLIVAYSQLDKLVRNKGHFDLKRFYLHRYFRLTPLYAAKLAFMGTVFPLVANGPDWNRAIKMSQIIQNNWWAYLLYINNFIPKVEKYVGNPLTVMSEAWYLACDMQMYWLSPLFIYPLWRWKKAGLVWVSTVFFLFVGAAAVVFMTIDMSPTFMFSRPSEMQALENYCRYNYHQMYARIPPYLLGIILGWLLHETKNRKVQMNRYLATAGWTTAVVVALGVMFGVIPYLDEVKVPTINPFFRVFYGSFHRSAWAAAVGWVIFACINGYGGFVNNLLSWKLFVPLARMCYAVYLIHFSFIKAYSSHMRKPLYFTEFYLYIIYVGILACSFILASMASVGIEMPFLNLDTLLFPNNAKTTKNKNRNEKVNDEELPMNKTPTKN